VTAPLSGWTLESTGACDGNGSFSFSVPVGTDPQKFYTVILCD
jgi:hypothetical protein